MNFRQFPLVAREGIPPLVLTLVVAALLLRYAAPGTALLPLGAFAFLFALFRDPGREVVPAALGAVSPVDGRVEAVDTTDRCVVQGEARRIRIRVDLFGAYTVRSPVEGRVMDLRSKTDGVGAECPANAMWVETDEGVSVVLQFHEYRLGIAPRSFARIGERVGQGQRCAYLRMARIAEVYLPVDSRVDIEPGQRVAAGTTLLGTVPQSRASLTV